MIGEPVVVIDDRSGAAQMARDMLGERGRAPRLEVAPTVAAGIALTVRLQPAAVIFLLAIEELVGTDALRRVHGAAPHSRVVVISRRPLSTAPSAVPIDGATVSWTLPARPESAGMARRVVSRVCMEAGQEPLVEDAQGVVSELVNNAVSHARTESCLTVRAGDGTVRIDLSDSRTERPTLRTPDLESTGGRGLLVIDALSSSWGIDPEPAGKRIWARVDAPAPSSDGDGMLRESVEVQNQYDGRWLDGFVVAGVDPGNYWLARRDGTRLGGPVSRRRVRPAPPAPSGTITKDAAALSTDDTGPRSGPPGAW